MSYRNEARRRALERYALPDAGAEEALDRLIGLAAQMLDAPVAVLGFLEGEQCRLDAVRGLEAESMPAASSFAAQVIEAGEGRILRDPEEPFAEGAASDLAEMPHVYAGVPLVVEMPLSARAPVAIGALCVLGDELSMPEAEALEALEGFATTAVEVMTLRERDRSFQLLFARNPHPMWVYDRETLRFLAVNDAAVIHYGYRRDEFLSMHITDIRPDEEAERLTDYLEQGLPRFRYSGYWKHQRADGSVIDVDITSSELEFEGRAAALIVAQDVTEQHAAEAALREREHYLTVTLDSIGDAVITTDIEGRVTGMNPVAEQLTGWTEDEATGHPLADVFHIVNAQTGASVESPVTKVLQHGHTVGLANHTMLIARGGTRHQIADSAAPIQSEDGEMLGVVMVFRDVTEAYERREALRRSKLTLEEAQHLAQMGNVELDLATDRFELSGAAARILGLKPNTAYPLDAFLKLIHSDDRPRMEGAIRQVIEAGDPFELEYRITPADQADERWIRGRGRALRDEAGRITGIFGVLTDITEQREAEAALRQSEERYRTLVERSHDAIYIYRGNRLLFVNERTCNLTGYAEDELLNIDVFELIHPDDRARVRRFARQRTEDAAPGRYEARLLRPDGTVRYGEFSVQPITYRGAYAVIGSIRDVTERRTIESTLRRRENKVQALYEAMGALTLTQTSALVAERLQALIIDTLGYRISAVRYLDDGALVPVTVSEEVRRRMPDRPEYEADGTAAVARAFQAGETAIYDDVRAVEGIQAPGAVRAVAYVPIGPYGILSVGSTEAGGIDPFDVTLIEILARNAESVLERIEREDALREARDAAKEVSRLKSAFLANMSHEIRTPLTSIIGFAEVLGGQELGEANTLLHLIRRGGQRLLDTLNSVLDLSQLEAGSMELQPARTDVATEMHNTVELFTPQARKQGLALVVDGVDTPVEARLDATALRRILSNLLSNAIKFTPDGGRIEVRLQTTRDGVTIEVEDTGIGIDEDFLPELFEAFKQESTGNARAFEGSGLGLAITRELVDLMHGEIEVASEKGEGTCFTVRLPQNWRADERRSG